LSSVIFTDNFQLCRRLINIAVYLPLSCTTTVVKELRAQLHRKTNMFVQWTPWKRDLWVKTCQNAYATFVFTSATFSFYSTLLSLLSQGW